MSAEWNVIPEKLSEGKYHIAGRGPRVVEGDEEVCLVPSRSGLTARNKAHDRACLIAAAPDLLAAAERIVALYDERWAASIGEIDDLRAAIRKARGEG
jgi:hypothetical protein